MAAPSLVAVGFVESLVAASATEATGSLTWQSGDVILAVASSEGAPGTETWVAPTTTGTGVTFTQKQVHAASSDPGAGCWSAVASAGSSGTFSVKNGNAANSQALAFGVYIFRGSAGVGNSNISTGTSRTVSLTPTGADGAIVWVVGDWAAAAVQTATPTATSHTTAAPGPSASPQAALVSGRFTYYVEELDDQTSAGAVSYGITGTGTGPFTIIAVEAQASGGGAAAAPIRPRFPSRVPIFRAANY